MLPSTTYRRDLLIATSFGFAMGIGVGTCIVRYGREEVRREKESDVEDDDDDDKYCVNPVAMVDTIDVKSSQRPKVRGGELTETVLRNIIELYKNDSRSPDECFADFLVNKTRVLLDANEAARVLERRRRDLSPKSKESLSLSQIIRECKDEAVILSAIVTFKQQMDTKEGLSVKQHYDYARSSNENYGVSSSDVVEFVGDYVDIRKTRDYAYHTHYTKRRQLWQDQCIECILSRTVPQPRPWIIFTCGAMGAERVSVSSGSLETVTFR